MTEPGARLASVRALLAVLVVTGLVAPAMLSVGAATASAAAGGSCGTQAVTVEHTAHRLHSATVDRILSEGSATTRAENTLVTVEHASVLDTKAFTRLTLENPNSYCVRYHVELAEEVVAPAELSRVDSIDGEHTATWRALYDSGRDESYTEVEVVVPGATTAVFAPSEARVKTLSWTGEASGILQRYLGDRDSWLESTHYSTELGDGQRRVTYRLDDPQSGETVDSYLMQYRVDGSDYWRPMSTDTTDGVSYRETAVDGSPAVEVTSEQSVEVRLVAEPSAVDKARYEVGSLRASADKALSAVPILGGDD